MGCTNSKNKFRNGSYEDFDRDEISVSVKEAKSIRSQSSHKILSSSEAHRIVSHQKLNGLKQSLTHPTILRFLRIYMKSQKLENYLDLYVKIVAAREMFKNPNRSSHGFELKKVVEDLYRAFIDEASLDSVPVNSHYSSMIKRARGPQPTFDGADMDLSLAMEGLRLVQYEVFFFIQEKCWLPFCETDAYATMIKKKEVRTTMALFYSEQAKPAAAPSSQKFTTVVLREEKRTLSDEHSFYSDGVHTFRAVV